jgi:hypothetical protein
MASQTHESAQGRVQIGDAAAASSRKGREMVHGVFKVPGSEPQKGESLAQRNGVVRYGGSSTVLEVRARPRPDEGEFGDIF